MRDFLKTLFQRLPSSSEGNVKIQTPVLIFSVILISLFLMFKMGPIGIGLVLVAMIIFMVIGHPKWLLLIYFSWAIYISPTIQTTLLSSPLFRVDEAMVVMMASLVLAYHILARPGTFHTRKIFWIMIILIMFALVSGYMNKIPKTIVGQYFSTYFRFFVFFFYTIHFFSNRDTKLILIIMILVFYSQVLLNLIWLTGINPIANSKSMTDIAIGSVGRSEFIAYLMIALSCLLLAIINHSRFISNRLLIAVCIFIALLQLVLTFAFHTYFLLAGCILFQFVLTKKITLLNKWVAFVGALLVAAALGLASQTDTYIGDITRNNLSVEKLQYRLLTMATGTKAKAYQDVFIHTPRYLPYPFLGAGPGNFGSITACNKQRPLATIYITYLWGSFEEMQLSEGHSITGRPDTGIITIWSELGPVGYLLFWGLHFYVMFKIIYQYRSGMYTDPYKRIMAEALPPVILMWIGLSFIADFLYIDFLQCGLWVWVACVWIPDINEYPEAQTQRAPQEKTEYSLQKNNH